MSQNENVTTLTIAGVGQLNLSSVQLSLKFNETGYVFPAYRFNNASWDSYWDSGVTVDIGSETNVTQFLIMSKAIDPTADPMIMLGKGFSSGLKGNFPDEVTYGGFNTIYAPDNGTVGTMYFSNLSFDLGTVIADTPTSVSTSVSTVTVSPTPTSNSQTPVENTSTPTVPLPISMIYVTFALILLPIIRGRRFIKK